MDIQLINGHNQVVFSEEDKIKIYDLFVNHDYSQRKLMREFGCAYKPMSRVLDELGLDHTRGNLTGFRYYYPNGIYSKIDEAAIVETLAHMQYMPPKIQRYSIDAYYFDDLRNAEVVYMLGLLFADGCNSDRNIVMCLEEQDKYMLDVINTNLQNENPIKFKDMSSKHDFGYTYKNQYALTIYNRRIVEVLQLLGLVNRKSWNLTFPTWLHPSLYSHFIRGYFDGNGSICKGGRTDSTNRYLLTITSTVDFCQAIVDICAKYIGIRGHIYDASNHNGITKVFSISGINVTKTFMDWMYQDATIFLRRKYNRYCDYFNVNNSLLA